MRKRSGGGRISAFTTTRDGEQGFWPSFADVMSSIALVLFFLMLLSYIQNLVTGNQLSHTRDELALISSQLSETTILVGNAQSELATLTKDLDDVRGALATEQDKLRESNDAIAWQDQTIAQQQDYINATIDELYKMQGYMQTIAVLRLSIVDQVKAAIEEVVGDEASVRVGENGNIILEESLLFDYDSAKIKPESEEFLVELGNAFYLFLVNPENEPYVDAIVVAGHTDNKGSASYNRDLSTKRANAVMDFIMANIDLDLTLYDDKFAVSGYGSTRPIDTNDTEEGRQNNRRIEISIILRDESILQLVEEYLGEPLPENGSAEGESVEGEIVEGGDVAEPATETPAPAGSGLAQV